MTNMGVSILKDKNPSGPKSMFVPKINPINHAARVAVTAIKYTARFPFRLNIKNNINMRNNKNSRILQTNPFISVASKFCFVTTKVVLPIPETFNPYLWALIVVASNTPVYTLCRLLVAEGQAPSASTRLRPTHKPPAASADLFILGRRGRPAGLPRRAHGCR